jgi:peptidoglycan hydrolase-like protein with peptidoglycan-binding domain
MNKNRLWKFSIALILLNLIVGGVVIFNHVTFSRQVDQAKANYESEVLGTGNNIPVFSPNFVMSNDTFRSTRVFPSQASVQSYLDSVQSPLRNYTDNGQTASYWIFNAARGNSSSKFGISPRINPGVIIAYLEKEQSLMSYKDYDVYGDPENRIRTAMGYGCPDLAQCESTYFGFANQVNWGAYQLELNFQQATTNGGGTQYVLNNTITTLDEYNVFLSNSATVAQYRYTPHVYWGNYNLWKILTANGWGVDPNTYSMTALDDVNLANKDATIGGTVDYGITRSSIDSVLRTKFNFGQQSESISNLQKFLRQEGYYMTREINGMYGATTKAAHEAYLLDNGIAFATGVNTSTSSSCNALISRSWTNYTDYGQEGRDLQQCLRDIGVFDWPTNTGFVGDVTTAALAQGRLILGIGGSTSPTPSNQSCESYKTAGIPFGETSERVRQLQACMRAAGVFNWPQGDTGYYGPVTREAFNQWTGGASATQAAPVGDCESLKSQTYTFGETGPRIVQLQGCMRAAGVFTWPFGDTGYYGPVSLEAFNAWTGGGATVQFSCDDLKEQVWTKGERSERVRQLQGCMRAAGVFNWQFGDTGYFGDVTEASIIQWRGFL